jgi:hypothetical protein
LNKGESSFMTFHYADGEASAASLTNQNDARRPIARTVDRANR